MQEFQYKVKHKNNLCSKGVNPRDIKLWMGKENRGILLSKLLTSG